MQTIAEFAPEGLESGVGLALGYDLQHFAFVLAGKRHRCLPGELFYVGTGGPRSRMPLGHAVGPTSCRVLLVVWVRPGNCTRQDIADLLRQARDY